VNAPTILAHRVLGQGEPVLLLNGGMMTYPSWDPVSRRLAEEFRVILCDLRGQLLSPGDSHSELAENLEDLERLLDHLSVDRAHLIGTSYGGELGLLMAAERPDRVRSLIAAAVVDRATAEMAAGAERLRMAADEAVEGEDGGRIHDLLVERVYSPAYLEAHREELEERRRQIESLPASWFAGLRGILEATRGLDLRLALARIACPTLVIAAAQDKIMPRERMTAVAEAVAGAELRVHPSSGHALVIEDPDWLAETCLEFLRGQAASGWGQVL
jgi:pimeloyl-ACP methyl ester carboxylesterase